MYKTSIISGILFVGDAILMYVSLFFALGVRYDDFAFFPGPQARQFFTNFSLIYVVWLALLYSFDFYDVSALKNINRFLKNLAIFSILSFAAGAVYFYLNPRSQINPKTILLFDVVIFAVFVFLFRLLVLRIISAEIFKKNIAIIGWSPEVDELAANFLPRMNYKVETLFNPRSLTGFENLSIFSRPEDFIRETTEKKIDLIVIASSQPRENEMVLNLLANTGGAVKTVELAAFYEETVRKIPLELIDQRWILRNVSRDGNRNYAVAKKTFDLFFSFIGTALTVIIFPLIYLAVKLDSRGPVFYIQNRKGEDGRIFKLYKFRTMKVSENQYEILRTSNNQLTRVGAILKRIHIDELPQFFNILRGDLSFVGPRPEWDKLAVGYERQIPFYNNRYLVRPGLTGWAQINYPASCSTEEAKEKFKFDLYYIKNRSFILDIAIMMKTVQLFFR